MCWVFKAIELLLYISVSLNASEQGAVGNTTPLCTVLSRVDW